LITTTACQQLLFLAALILLHGSGSRGLFTGRVERLGLPCVSAEEVQASDNQPERDHSHAPPLLIFIPQEMEQQE
jgi:hypothetical protein